MPKLIFINDKRWATKIDVQSTYITNIGDIHRCFYRIGDYVNCLYFEVILIQSDTITDTGTDNMILGEAAYKIHKKYIFGVFLYLYA